MLLSFFYDNIFMLRLINVSILGKHFGDGQVYFMNNKMSEIAISYYSACQQNIKCIVLPFPLEFEDCPVLFAIFSSSPGERGGSFPCGSFPGTTPPAFAANSRTLQGNQWMTSAKFAAFDNCKVFLVMFMLIKRF